MLVEQSPAFHQAVWEYTADAMALSDAEGIVRAANPAYYQLYGYTPAEVIGASFAMLFPKDQRAQAIAHYQMVFREELVVPAYEATIRHKNGTERIVEARAEFLTLNGTRVAMLSIIHDITERRQTREALQEQQQFLHTLLEQFPNGSISVYDTDLRYLVAEGKGLAQLGLASHQLVGKTLADIFPKEVVAYVTPFYQKAFQGEAVVFELPFGGYVYEIHAAPLKYARMAISAILAIAQDITARKQAEAERLELLTREQAARREAQEAVRVRDAFLSVASHELKNRLCQTARGDINRLHVYIVAFLGRKYNITLGSCYRLNINRHINEPSKILDLKLSKLSQIPHHPSYHQRRPSCCDCVQRGAPNDHAGDSESRSTPARHTISISKALKPISASSRARSIMSRDSRVRIAPHASRVCSSATTSAAWAYSASGGTATVSRSRRTISRR
jgi:PAS domain S-box-containing protein